ncbi:phosphotransferase family protein [Nocardia harenae]|uniref:phosphotransferase family protein n=1 Tax=Nocardia harenae TaxID=358707 RepID=UPI00082FF7AD|nr:phosphotransferase family protein [Nocardia harenae]
MTHTVAPAATPGTDTTAAVRDRYPTDPARQRAVDRKYARRAGPGWTPIGLGELAHAVRGLLAEQLGGAAFEVRDPRWLTGGASKIQMAFDLVTGADAPRRLLLRMDPPESLNATLKTSEFEVLRGVAGALPTPEVLWVDDAARHLPEPGLICGFVDGVTKPTRTTSGQVSGLGTDFGRALRAPLGAQLIGHLAALHTLDPSSLESAALSLPAAGSTECAAWQLGFERQLWTLDRLGESAIMELAAHWLARNLPVLDRASVVHGDFRSGNFLFDEGTATITAWLDWESAHLGDRHYDLAYCAQDLFGHYDESGKTFLVSGLVPRSEFFARYEEASGLPVDPERLRWYTIFCGFSATVKTLATCLRIAQLGRSHQDVLLARLEGTVPILLGQLGRRLEEVV